MILEPRGLIRVLQFIFAIFAFATACSGSSSVLISYQNTNNSISASWWYPYNLPNTPITLPIVGLPSISISDTNDVKPSAEFFVFVGTTSMIIALAFSIMYVCFDHQYRNNQMIPIVDLFITLIWSIFWVAGSIAWAKGVSNLRAETDIDQIGQRSTICAPTVTCTGIQSTSLLLVNA